jgi:hypothetical protein
MRNSILQVFIYFNSNILLRTNCTTNEECWRDALAYRSWELIEEFVSFSSLSVHVDAFQREHPSEVCI